MAELPPAKLQIDTPQFLHVGVDCLRPVDDPASTGNGESLWMHLHVHDDPLAVCLDIAADLSTGTLMNTIRLFFSRYGNVIHLYSDDGTNLVGAERVLPEAIQGWNQAQIYDETVSTRHPVEL